MKIKQLIYFLLLLAFPKLGVAQEIIVKSFEEASATSLGKTIGDIPKTNQGEDAAVVVVKVHRNDISFEGRILRDLQGQEYSYENGEYTLYVAPRSKSITIKIPGFNDKRVNVADYENTIPDGLQSRRMYVMYVNVVPKSVLGGRNLSWGISGGYLMPMISESADNFTGSPINYGLGNSSENADYKNQKGFIIGINADIRMHKNFYLNIGINYGEYTYTNELTGFVEGRYALNAVISKPAYLRAKESYKQSFLEVPIYVSYRFPVTKRSNIQLGVGPVVSYGLSSKMKFANELMYSGLDNVTTNSQVINYIEYMGDMDLYSKSINYSQNYSYVNVGDVIEKKNLNYTASPLKRLNFSVGAYLAYEIHGISLSVHYRYMVNNMADNSFWEGSRINIHNSPNTSMPEYKLRHNFLQFKIGYTLRY